MGKVKPDLAGAYVSKVGGVAYYIKDGVNYVRSLSKSGYKSNTPLQAGVKARFKSASQMAGQMKEIANIFRRKENKSAYLQQREEAERKRQSLSAGGDADLRSRIKDLYSKLSGDAGRKQLPSG